MQPRQPDWCSRAPAATRSNVAPIRVRSCRICREVGFTSNDTAGSVCRPLTIAAAIAKSRRPGLAEEPITTCSISVPATSSTGTTFPGELGMATSGITAARSMASCTSYSASSSATSST